MIKPLSRPTTRGASSGIIRILAIAIFLITELQGPAQGCPLETHNISTSTHKIYGSARLATNTVKCFSNDGLKYSVNITIIYLSQQRIKGKVETREVESGAIIDAGIFKGSNYKGKLKINFLGKKPLVGSNSNWTNSPWIIDTVNGSEVLKVIFMAKNYHTNKWESTVYEFPSCN